MSQTLSEPNLKEKTHCLSLAVSLIETFDKQHSLGLSQERVRQLLRSPLLVESFAVLFAVERQDARQQMKRAAQQLLEADPSAAQLAGALAAIAAHDFGL